MTRLKSSSNGYELEEHFKTCVSKTKGTFFSQDLKDQRAKVPLFFGIGVPKLRYSTDVDSELKLMENHTKGC